MRNLLFILLVTTLFSSCSKDMKTAEREIEIGSFNTLTIDNRFNLILTQGTQESLTVSGHPKLIEKVYYKLDSNELHISSSFKSAWLRPKNNKVTLHITVKDLKRININETCDLSCSNELLGDEIGMVVTAKMSEAKLKLNCNTFYFWNNFPCGGKVTLDGHLNSLKLWNYALMQIDATNLIAESAYVENYSKGDVTAKVNQNLIYKINGEGNIRIKGTPLTIESLGEIGIGKLIFE